MVSAVTHVGFDTVDGRHPAAFHLTIFSQSLKIHSHVSSDQGVIWGKRCINTVYMIEFVSFIAISQCTVTTACFGEKLRMGRESMQRNRPTPWLFAVFWGGLHYIQSYTGNLMNPSVEWNVTYGFVLSVARPHVVRAISSINSKMSDEFFLKFESVPKVSRSSDAATFATSVGGGVLGCSFLFGLSTVE